MNVKWKIAKSLVKCCFNATKGNHFYKSFWKSFRIVTGDEKWIYFENPKRKKSWLSPGEAGPSTPRLNRFGKKTMLCVWWMGHPSAPAVLPRPGAI
ncbi:hypothetical protein P5V15_003476 [Pogonomyrmex californicus]